eukprot:GHVR01185308.1.p1 GENE.GHVR01185308.1~~GHVR01185308.1.p1  ORF type:complete len:144 (+),score=6.42 GHVR01185308.1:273-704(+)
MSNTCFVCLFIQDEDTPLILASRKGLTDIARLLIDKGADVNVQDKDEDTPLILATNKGLTDIVRLLIDKGADVNVQAKDEDTPLILASRKGLTDIARFLIDKGAEVNAVEIVGIVVVEFVVSCDLLYFCTPSVYVTSAFLFDY